MRLPSARVRVKRIHKPTGVRIHKRPQRRRAALDAVALALGLAVKQKGAESTREHVVGNHIQQGHVEFERARVLRLHVEDALEKLQKDGRAKMLKK